MFTLPVAVIFHVLTWQHFSFYKLFSDLTFIVRSYLGQQRYRSGDVAARVVSSGVLQIWSLEWLREISHLMISSANVKLIYYTDDTLVLYSGETTTEMEHKINLH